ncbi:unnamed protein product [Echinostoma caproni]|uniref:DUF3421 domain-containing protein n=1 Tax=Echinostoma caproni TaxID=27848 RepID=A0A183ACS3_9TREM|nr:unnamed protein product [Echinostoma caproni]
MAKVEGGYQMTLSWVPLHEKHLPSNAVCAGDNVYVGRGMMGSEMVPGKYVQGHSTLYVPYGGQEVSVHHPEILCVTGQGYGQFYTWEFARDGNVPNSSVCAAIAGDGNPVFVARGRVQGEVCVGKMHAGHNSAYFPWGGQEIPMREYEVLVWRKKN